MPDGRRVERVLDRRAAIRDALAAARPGDVVVIAGKGHETGQTVGGRAEPFDDRVVAREELEALRVTHRPRPRSRAHAGGRRRRAPPTRSSTSWAFDSRALEPGACFVALRGDRDGHDFVDAAFAAGARVALVVDAGARASSRRRAPRSCRSTTSLAALQELARACRAARPELRVVGVAGSTGKTSTKDLLAAVLAPLGCYASPESYNNEFGLPITLLNAPADAPTSSSPRWASGSPATSPRSARSRSPTIGVVTNVGLAHAEHLGGADGRGRGDGRAARRAAGRAGSRC